MKSREMRMRFKPLKGFESAYKINYIGEVYSVKFKKLKMELEGSYRLRGNGRIYQYTKRDIQKLYFQDLDSDIEYINVYSTITVKKINKAHGLLEGLYVYKYSKNKLNETLVGVVISSTENDITIELCESKYEQEFIEHYNIYKAHITNKDDILIELVSDEQIKVLNSKNYTNMELDRGFRSKHRGTKLKSREQVMDIYRKSHSGKFKDTEIAKEYSIEPSVVIRIKYGISFNDITRHKQRLINDYKFQKGSSRYNSIIDEKVAMIIYKLCYDKDLNIKQKDIATAFGLNTMMVTKIKHGESWAHVTGHGKRLNKLKLTNKDIIEIYTRSNKGESHKSLAEEFGVTPVTIYNIKNKRTRAKLIDELIGL